MREFGSFELFDSSVEPEVEATEPVFLPPLDAEQKFPHPLAPDYDEMDV